MCTQTATRKSVKIRSSVHGLCHIPVCVSVGTGTNLHLQCVYAHTCRWILSLNHIHFERSLISVCYKQKKMVQFCSVSYFGFRICKGPEWKPGIFVQFTKKNGLAREAGLQPGDQILQCNGVPFLNIPFSDVSEMMGVSLFCSENCRSFPFKSGSWKDAVFSVTIFLI